MGGESQSKKCNQHRVGAVGGGQGKQSQRDGERQIPEDFIESLDPAMPEANTALASQSNTLVHFYSDSHPFKFSVCHSATETL